MRPEHRSVHGGHPLAGRSAIRAVLPPPLPRDCGCGCGRCRSIGDLSLSDLSSGNYAGALASASPTASTVAFQASAVMGTALNDANTAEGVYNTFQNSGVDYSGDQGKKQMQDIGLALQLIPGLGTALGGALIAIANAVGFAHAGPGVCATDAPPDYGWGTLKAWPHYIDWAHSAASEPTAGPKWSESTDPPGSFESYANLALAYNQALFDNCFSNVAVTPEALPALLAQLIDAWNKTHLGPTRTVSRVMPCGAIGCTAKGWDPIADALYWTDPSGRLAGKTLTFQVNAGAHIQKVLKGILTVHVRPPPAPGPAQAAAPSGPSAAAVVVVGGAAAAAAVAIFKPALLARLLRF